MVTWLVYLKFSMVSRHNTEYIRGQPFVSPTFPVSLPLTFHQHFTLRVCYTTTITDTSYALIRTHKRTRLKAYTGRAWRNSGPTYLRSRKSLVTLFFSVLIYSSQNILHRHQHLAVSFPWNNRKHCQKLSVPAAGVLRLH